LRTHHRAHPHGRGLRLAVALAALAATAALPTAPAQAGSGGISSDPGSSSAPRGHAKLVHGKAIPPSNAPGRVVRVIEAANHIRKKPYKWGGGHGRWNDRGYDCSGSVSYALHGGRLLRRPLDSSGFMHWARPGKGRWITVFSNPGHAFMVVAGLRFDTSMVRGDGPGWSKRIHAEHWRDFRKRHKARY
jgi:cell wall-associated NlpC family hydrolase